MNFESFQFWAVTAWMVLMIVLAVKAVVELLRDGHANQPAEKAATNSDPNHGSSGGQNT
ncbi:MAG: hypothetical protein ACO34E_00135 [Limisphaerales bacterium]|jgi:hypothetical protein